MAFHGYGIEHYISGCVCTSALLALLNPIRVLEGEHHSICLDCDQVLTFKGCRGMLGHHGKYLASQGDPLDRWKPCSDPGEALGHPLEALAGAHLGQLAGLHLQPNQQENKGARGPSRVQAHQSPGAVMARPQALEQAQGGPSTDIICQNEPGPTGLGRPALSWLWRCFWDSSLARIDEGQGQILGHLFHISNDANNLLLITCCMFVIPNSGHD